MYKSREEKLININNLIAEIRKVKRIEKEIALTNSKKTIAFTKKWHIIIKIVPEHKLYVYIQNKIKIISKKTWQQCFSVSF